MRVSVKIKEIQMKLSIIEKADKKIYDALALELERQRGNLELIASENFVSPAVMAAVGSHLTNKYAEGYPAKRYYGGCQYVDIVEDIAIERVKALYGASFANVQAHSGASANLAVYYALINVGDTVLGMNLSHGGHLTHGSKVNFSGKQYNIVSYGVEEGSEVIDYDKVMAIAKMTRPKMIIAGASAYPRALDFAAFRKIADEVGAYLVVDMAHIAGLVAAGLHMNPVPYADVVTTTTHKTLRGPRGGVILTNSEELATKINKAVFPGIQGGPLMHVIAGKAVAFGEALQEDFKVYQQQTIDNAKAMSRRFVENGIELVSGGTDNHLMLLKLASKNRTGKEIEALLDEAHITVNKNAIPFDKERPAVTSGIRIGTPSITTRGMKQEESELIADLITEIIISGAEAVQSVADKVEKLCSRFPLYGTKML